ncbi:hypothetical protein HK098_000898 [Nowakowskiella sp. JEL0407]|nr:hypothetical protein HK098_000898 [Nowakowskiella sp. JEL0407]
MSESGTGTIITSSSSSRGCDIAIGMQQMRLEDAPKLPPRPGFGQSGHPIKLLANFYGLQIPDRMIHQYDVAITPDDVRPAATNRRIFEAWRALPDHSSQQRMIVRLAAYDGQKNFFSPARLDLGPEEEMTWDIDLSSEDSGKNIQQFKIRIQATTQVNMSRLHEYLAGNLREPPRDAISALETLMRQRPTAIFASKNTKTGGSFYQLFSSNSPDLGGGLCVQQGWYQACRITVKQMLMLNLDVSATSFYKPGSLIDTVCEFFEVPEMRRISPEMFNRGRTSLEKFLRQVTVSIEYREEGRKRYKIRGISAAGADRQQMKIPQDDTTNEGSPFYGEDPNSTITVQEYYFKMFNIQLKYPYFPVILSGQYKQIHIPMELCTIKENQRFSGKLGDIQLANIIKITASNPQERFRRIEAGRRVLHSELSQHELLGSWGVSIDPKLAVVDARVLQAPRLQQGTDSGRGRGGRGGGGRFGGGNTIVTPNNGVWRLDAFYQPATLRFWSVLVVGRDRFVTEDKIYNFTRILAQQLSNKGMRIENWEPNVIFQGDRSIRAGLIEANKWARPDGSGGPSPDRRAELILCVLCDPKMYDEVKRVAEVELGLMTQCCQFKKTERANPAYCSNLALKINAKLGGTNNILVPSFLNDIKQISPQANERMMIFGADVSHPAPSQMRNPNAISIAAMTANIDTNFWEYRGAVRAQSGKLERITDTQSMIKELVSQYTERNEGKHPNRVIFFRDGVSEGQFEEVLYQELPAIRRAFESAVKHVPKITFVVMNKRHHVRFAPQNASEGDSKSGNIPSGTVVDRDVVHPCDYDFYLTAQAGIQGTSRPTHYHILWDENDFTPDELQEITYRLCFLFNRCSRAVSLVPAAYYAHLVAYRARCHVGIPDDFSETSSSTASAQIGRVAVAGPVKSRMYFA